MESKQLEEVLYPKQVTTPPPNIVAVICAFIRLEVARSFEMADLPFIVNACRGSAWLLRGELKKCDLTDDR